MTRLMADVSPVKYNKIPFFLEERSLQFLNSFPAELAGLGVSGPRSCSKAHDGHARLCPGERLDCWKVLVSWVYWAHLSWEQGFPWGPL